MSPEQTAPVAARQAPDKRPEKIAGMFDAIARRYDLLNHVLSGGADWYWRWRAIRALRLGPDDAVLDLCTGTGDLAIETLRRSAARRVVGVDFAGEMLRIAHEKLRKGGFASKASLVRGDAMGIPIADRSVQAVTIAFGIRNVLDPLLACREMYRVLGPGGRLAVLEFSMPTLPVVGAVYRWYFRNVLPVVGRVVSRHGEAYDYLPSSVGAFFTPDEFTTLLARAGFIHVRAVSLTLGVVYLYVAVKG